jgi:hypothetical protein
MRSTRHREPVITRAATPLLSLDGRTAPRNARRARAALRPPAAMAPGDAAAVPPSRRYVLRRARVPLACLEGVDLAALEPDVDRLALVDIEVRDGLIHSITPAAAAPPPAGGARAALARLAGAPPAADLRGRMVLPTFVDLHTHIDKGHTAERSRNPDGSLSGADRSTAADAAFWDAADVERRVSSAASLETNQPTNQPTNHSLITDHYPKDGLCAALRVRARHVRAAHAPDQHDAQAGGADVASLCRAARALGRPRRAPGRLARDALLLPRPRRRDGARRRGRRRGRPPRRGRLLR